jgi:hypothetical protein
MRPIFFAALFLCPIVAGCAERSAAVRPASVTVEAPEPWRVVSAAQDAAQIDTLPAIWTRIAARIPPRRAKLIAAEGPLLEADAALELPQLSPGSYSCRVVRIGATAGTAQVRSFPANFCYIALDTEGTLTLTKQTGSDLPAGRLYPAGDKRYVFLGARQSRVGDNSIAYGTTRDRDIVGVVERFGAFRWRMVSPSRDGRSIDVYEMTPVPADRQPE